MKKLEQDDQTKRLLKKGLLEKAPGGMVDRVMATIAVSPVRRLSIKPVEPVSNVAVIVPLISGILVAIAAFIKPVSRFSFSLDQYINIDINPIWIAPLIVISLTVWGYIFIAKRQNFMGGSNF